jgi:hypothetical protein
MGDGAAADAEEMFHRLAVDLKTGPSAEGG